VSGQRPLVAVDGAAGSGKSTLSRSLAQALGVPYINTGLMYRALAAAALETGASPNDARALVELARGLRFTLGPGDPVELYIEGYPDDRLTTMEVESTVSTVAKHPEVRAWMRARQRELGGAGAVMEGRDIATTVFPQARLKLFLRAEGTARAARRAVQRGAEDADREAGALRSRDASDARTVPLEPTADAVVLDTDRLDIEETLEAALRAVRRVWPGETT
jgi:cytidylate kinase